RRRGQFQLQRSARLGKQEDEIEVFVLAGQGLQPAFLQRPADLDPHFIGEMQKGDAKVVFDAQFFRQRSSGISSHSQELQGNCVNVIAWERSSPYEYEPSNFVPARKFLWCGSGHRRQNFRAYRKQRTGCAIPLGWTETSRTRHASGKGKMNARLWLPRCAPIPGRPFAWCR